MSVLRIAFFAACGVALMSGTAFAQQSPRPTPTPPPGYSGVPSIGATGQGSINQLSNPGLIERENFGRALSNTVQSPARVERAERAAVLINEGKCDEALTLARDARDQRLGRRIEAVCSSANP